MQPHFLEPIWVWAPLRSTIFKYSRSKIFLYSSHFAARVSASKDLYYELKFELAVKNTRRRGGPILLFLMFPSEVIFTRSIPNDVRGYANEYSEWLSLLSMLLCNYITIQTIVRFVTHSIVFASLLSVYLSIQKRNAISVPRTDSLFWSSVRVMCTCTTNALFFSLQINTRATYNVRQSS